MSKNPFAEREPAKKRIISASLTADQREAFDQLKDRTHTVTDGAMIKKALSEMIDRFEREDRLDTEQRQEPWPPATVA